MRRRLLAVCAIAAAILLTITFGHAQQRATPQPAPAAPAAQRGQQPYQLDRTACLSGRPNFSGIWQAMNSANWNLEAHNAEPLTDFWRLGAIAAIPAESSPRRPSDPEAVRAVRALLDSQVTAWNRHDLDGFLAGYRQDEHVVFTTPGDSSRGFAELEQRDRKSVV